MQMHCHVECMTQRKNWKQNQTRPPYIDLLTMETVSTAFYYEGEDSDNEMYSEPGEPVVQATVTIASLIGTSIGEAQQVCPEIGPMYSYVANNELPGDDKLA